MAKVSFLGLGVMGYPMAGHLLKKGGHDVTVYNRSPAKAAQWVKEYGGKSAATPKEAAQGADFVLMCVGNDDDVRSVVYGDNGVLAGMKKGAILVDHTTASAVVAREVHARKPRKKASASSTRRSPAARRARSTGSSASCAAASRPTSTRRSRCSTSTPRCAR